jgi:transposase-like protein
MQRRKWDAKAKAMMVIEGLQGKPVAAICTEHQISPSQDYQWRDQLLAHAAHACESQQSTKKAARLEQENRRLKQRVGGLTLALQKSDERLA